MARTPLTKETPSGGMNIGQFQCIFDLIRKDKDGLGQLAILSQCAIAELEKAKMTDELLTIARHAIDAAHGITIANKSAAAAADKK